MPFRVVLIISRSISHRVQPYMGGGMGASSSDNSGSGSGGSDGMGGSSGGSGDHGGGGGMM